MTALAYLPNMQQRMDRITDAQRQLNIAAEGQPVNVYTDPRVADELAMYDNYRTAKAVLISPHWHSADMVHAALDFVHEYESAIPGRQKAQPVDDRVSYGKVLAALGLGYAVAALQWWGL